MMNCYKIACLLLLLSLLIACDNSDNTSELECDKLKSIEETIDLISEENANGLIDSSAIMANVIGDWGLIGVQPGWHVGFEAGAECIKLTIDEDNILFQDLNTGDIRNIAWSLRKIQVNNYIGFYFETDEDVWNNKVGMELFTGELMYGSGRVDDGDIYIYEKLD